MAITFDASFLDIPNVSFPLTPATPTGVTLRVRSGVTGNLGTITIVGGSQTKTVTMKGSPLPSWIAWSLDGDVVTLSVKSPIQSTQLNNFFLVVLDGTSTAYYGISIDVKPSFALVTEGTTNNLEIPLYDPTFPAVQLRGKGEGGSTLGSGICIIPPPALPTGFNLYTTDGSGATLEVDPASLAGGPGGTQDLSGGMKADSASTYSFKAYCPGTMYDNPSRPYLLMMNVVSRPSKAGTAQTGLSCKWDPVNKYYSLKMHLDYTEGSAQEVEYEWIAPTGTKTGGGDWSNNYLNWTPTADGSPTITCRVVKKGARTSQITTSTINLPSGKSTDAVWPAGVKAYFDQPFLAKFTGEAFSTTLTVDSADAGANTVNVAFTLLDSTGATVAGAPASVTMSGPTTVINYTPPAGFDLMEKLTLLATITVGTGGSAKTGKAAIVFVSKGPSPLTLTGPTTLSQDGATFNGASYSVTSNSTPVSGCNFSLVNAPAGLTILNGQLSGSVWVPGTHNFKVRATKAGYAPTTLAVTLTVTVPQAVSFDPLTPSSSVVDDGKQFTLTWGKFGAPSDVLLQKNFDYPESVLGRTSYSTSLVGTSVYSLVGVDYRGSVYTTPVVVASSAGIQVDALPMAQIEGTIDHTNNMTLNWSPVKIGGAYTLYKGWMIRVKSGVLDPDTLYVNGALPTGLESGGTPDSRSFSSKVKSGTLGLDMFAVSSDKSVIGDGPGFPQFLQFPDPLTSDSISLDKTTASKGESIALSLVPSYKGADAWRVVYSDGQATDWYPLTIRNVAKSFTSAGQMSFRVEVKKNFPDQKLTLLRTLPLGVYIQDQDYNPGVITSTGGLGDIGIGGEIGFEMSESKDGVSPSESYEVIVKALVSDTVTQEVKLLVATARTRDASSLKGTMALDVFPLIGRPHMKDLVKPGSALPTPAKTTPVKIKSKATLPDATVGRPIKEFVLEAEGGTKPYSWYSDNLPAGLRLSIDGTLSGTMLQSGTYSINFSVKDATNPASIDQTSLVMVAKSDLMITTNTMPDATVGTNYSNKVVVGGGLAPYSFKVASGSLPMGLTLHPTSGTISGVPCTWNSTTDFDTSWSFTVEVTDSVSSKQSKTLTMKLVPMSLTLGDVDQTLISSGLDYRLAVPVYGGYSPYTLVDVVSDGSVSDSLRVLGPSSVVAISGKDLVPLSITSNKTYSTTLKEVSGQSSYPVSFSLAATGGTSPYNWSLDPTAGSTTLPGCKVDPSGTVTGSVPYKTGDLPTKEYQVVVKVTDASGKAANGTFRVVVTIDTITKPANYGLKVCSIATGPTYFELKTTLSSLNSWAWGQEYKPLPAASRYAIIPWDLDNDRPLWTTQMGNGSISGPAFPSGRVSLGNNTTTYIGYGLTCEVVIRKLLYDAAKPAVDVPMFIFGGTPIAPTGGITAGNNIVTASFSSSVDPSIVVSGNVSFPSPGAVATSDPTIDSTPDLTLRYSKLVTKAGTTYTITSNFRHTLSAVGGVAPYGYTIKTTTSGSGPIAGMTITGNVLSWNTTLNNATYLTGSGTYPVQIMVRDANGATGVSTFNLKVVEEVVTAQEINIVEVRVTDATGNTSYLGPSNWNARDCAADMSGGASVLVVADGFIATATINGVQMQREATNSQRMSVNPSTGKTTYNITVTNTTGSTSSYSISINWYRKTLNVAPLRSYMDSGQTYSPANGTHPVVWEMYGYTETEASSVNLGVNIGSITGNTNVLVTPSSGGTVPVVKYAPSYSASAPGTAKFTMSDTSRGLSASTDIPVKGSTMTVTPKTVNITVAATEVIPSSTVTKVEKVFSYPVEVANNIGPVKMHWNGTNSTQWSYGGDNTDSTFKIDFTNSNLKAGETYNMQVNFDVSDSYKTFTNQVGWINMTVQKPAQLSLASSDFVFTWPGPGETGNFCTYQLVNVLYGKPLLTQETVSLSIPLFVKSFMYISPKKWGVYVNNYTAFGSVGFAEVMGDNNTFAFVVGATSMVPANTGFPPSGSYKCSATMQITDADGLSQVKSFPFTIVVPDYGQDTADPNA